MPTVSYSLHPVILSEALDLLLVAESMLMVSIDGDSCPT